MYKAMAKSSFSVPKALGAESSFTQNKEYDCVKRSNSNFVIKDNEGSALELDLEEALNNFWIKEN